MDRKMPNELVLHKQPRKVRNLLIGNTLGKGSYGVVKEAIEEKGRERVAVKICSQRALKRIPQGMQLVQQEIKTLQMLSKHKHPNIITLKDHWVDEDKEKVYIVLELISGGSLQEFLRSNGPLSQSQARSVFKDLINGIQHLQKHGITHGDIKPDNLLITSDGRIKIIDFTVATSRCEVDSIPSKEYSAVEDSESSEQYSSISSPKCGSGQGTPAFQPPEVINGEINFLSAGVTLDLWSAGIVLYIMVVGVYPFKGASVCSLLDNISKADVDVPAKLDPNLRDLLSKLLARDRSERLSIKEILSHEWMEGHCEPIQPKLMSSMFVKKRNLYKVRAEGHSHHCALL